MQLTKIDIIKGQIKLLTGLHIGAGSDVMHIGGIDNPVVRHPHNRQPYIPGSSIKGKVRSLLELKSGVIGKTDGKPLGLKDLNNLQGQQLNQATAILKLFGASGDASGDENAKKIGPTRLSFWDANLNSHWSQKISDNNLPHTEAKSENTINRIKAVAENPRQTERVPADAIFDFQLTFKHLQPEDQQLLHTILQGLKLLEIEGLGGSGSRGYGKIKLQNLQLNDQPLDQFDNLDPFA